MDPLRIHASKSPRSIKKHKSSQRLLNDFILYSLTTLACTSFCSSPFWYPPFCATFNVFFFFSLPKITSFFFTSKVLFIVGNLIIIFLLGESKFYASMSKAYNDVKNDKYECKPLDQINQVISSSCSSSKTSKDVMQVEMTELKTCDETDHEEFFEMCDDHEDGESDGGLMVKGCSDHEGLGGDEDSLHVEELNKMVDDFIARVNRQRMLEYEFGRG